MKTWKPWDDYKPEECRLPIQSPPCEFCYYWRPQRKYSKIGYDGVTCCAADDMEHDFSCFREKEQ